MQEIQRFKASDDQGNAYELVVYQEFAPSRHGDVQVPTRQSLRTSDGFYVNWLQSGEYELMYYGRVRLTSQDSARV